MSQDAPPHRYFVSWDGGAVTSVSLGLDSLEVYALIPAWLALADVLAWHVGTVNDRLPTPPSSVEKRSEGGGGECGRATVVGV
jgi:hypothetical protein